MNYKYLLVPPGKKIRLKNFAPGYTGKFKSRKTAGKKLEQDIQKLAQYQDVLYAQNIYAVLLVFQALDAAGKDSAIKHVMSGINPQGCQVFSFKAPSAEELDHDYLWRYMKALPERGRFGIFNRSYYEEVLVVRVHPEILEKQQLPPAAKGKNIWKDHYDEINNFEKYLVQNGVIVIKFFLNVSKKEQKQRFLDRLTLTEKNWKFSATDAKERISWNKYMKAYEDVFNHTSTKWAPWHIIPADHKWFTRVAIADIIISRLKSLKLSYPTVTQQHNRDLLKTKRMLERGSL
jgi:PPK2 family polyphosphate:nucleotide phosphotransferase